MIRAGHINLYCMRSVLEFIEIYKTDDFFQEYLPEINDFVTRHYDRHLPGIKVCDCKVQFPAVDVLVSLLFSLEWTTPLEVLMFNSDEEKLNRK